MLCPLCGSAKHEVVLSYEEYPLYIKPIPVNIMEEVPLHPLEIDLCDHCGFIYQNPQFDSAEIEKIYEVAYHSYHSPARSGIGSTLATECLHFLESYDIPKKKRILEIGCFDGYFLSLLRDSHRCSVIGCDPSPGSLIAQDLDVEVIPCYFSADLFVEEFDAIVLRGVLEHVPDPIGLLRSIQENLSKDGYLVIEVPNVNYSLNNGVIGDFFHEHLSYFSSVSLINCLNRAGYHADLLEHDGYYIRGIFVKRHHETVSSRPFPGEVKKYQTLFSGYVGIIQRLTKELEIVATQLLTKDIYIYGGGGHTIGLLSKTHQILKPLGIIDGDLSKEGKIVPGFNIPVYSPETLERLDMRRTAVIISSKIFADEILSSLAPYIKRGLTAIQLYPNVMLIDNHYSSEESNNYD